MKKYLWQGAIVTVVVGTVTWLFCAVINAGCHLAGSKQAVSWWTFIKQFPEFVTDWKKRDLEEHKNGKSEG